MDGSIYGGLLIHGEQQTSYDELGGGEISARLATSPEVFRDAWMLRHAAYSSHGFIETNANGMFMDECDHYASTKVVVVYRNNSPIGTVRVCLYAPESGIDGANSIPAMDVFHDEITNLLQATPPVRRGPRAVEVMRLATHPDIGSEREPALALFLMAGYLTLHFQANAVVCAVRRHHMPFYRRVGLQKMTEPRAYPKLKFETGLLACIRRDTEELQRSMAILRPISLDDDIFPDFIRGRPVPVFDSERSPATVNRLLSSRPEPAPSLAGLVPAHVAAYHRPMELGLAA